VAPVGGSGPGADEVVGAVARLCPLRLGCPAGEPHHPHGRIFDQTLGGWRKGSVKQGPVPAAGPAGGPAVAGRQWRGGGGYQWRYESCRFAPPAMPPEARPATQSHAFAGRSSRFLTFWSISRQNPCKPRRQQSNACVCLRNHARIAVMFESAAGSWSFRTRRRENRRGVRERRFRPALANVAAIRRTGGALVAHVRPRDTAATTAAAAATTPPAPPLPGHATTHPGHPPPTPVTHHPPNVDQ
jgi:hypothetical protein